MKKVSVINYGMGNIGSIQGALEYLGATVAVVATPAEIESADRLILPGVGSFRVATENLDRLHFRDSIRKVATEKKRPVLGICLGMQLLAETGEEGGQSQGLGLVPGEVKKFTFPDNAFKIPHVGFNSTRFVKAGSPLLPAFGESADFYFVHSYHFHPASPAHVSGTTHYGIEVTAAVENENVMGTQFHPEKSQANGLQVLKNFLAV